MHYAGLDVSLKDTAICVVDEKGSILKEGKTASEPDAIAQGLASVEVNLNKFGLEIGGLARWHYAELRARGVRAVCIDPRQLRGVTKTMPIKTDRNDARAIAQAMRVGWFSPVHVKSEASQELRMLLTNRKMLQTNQIDIDNEIRGTFTLDQRQAAEVAAVQVEKVEGHEYELGGIALQFVLKHGEIGRTVGGRNDNFPIDDRGACLDVPCVVGDLPEAPRPIVAATGVDGHGLIRQVHLNAITVELDLVNPPLARGDPLDRGGQRRFDKAGKGRLDADRRGLPAASRIEAGFLWAL